MFYEDKFFIEVLDFKRNTTLIISQYYLKIFENNQPIFTIISTSSKEMHKTKSGALSQFIHKVHSFLVSILSYFSLLESLDYSY